MSDLMDRLRSCHEHAKDFAVNEWLLTEREAADPTIYLEAHAEIERLRVALREARRSALLEAIAATEKTANDWLNGSAATGYGKGYRKASADVVAAIRSLLDDVPGSVIGETK